MSSVPAAPPTPSSGGGASSPEASPLEVLGAGLDRLRAEDPAAEVGHPRARAR